MKILFEELAQIQPISRAVIASLDMNLYQLFILTGLGEQLVWETATQPLVARSLGALRKRLENLAIDEIILRHQSAYDEMIGLPPGSSNTLTVPLGPNP